MFQWLEATPVALWVGASLWAYPFLLSLHVIGLAIVVGIFSIRDLRLLGLFPGINPAAFLSISKLAWGGFLVNAGSGALLFTSQAATFSESPPFLVKITAIIVAMVLARIIQTRLRNEVTATAALALTEPEVAAATRLIAGLSLTIWAVAIIAGRLIAYF